MDWDVIVLGAGVAGLSAAQYARYFGLRTLVVEQISPGGQAMNIPALENLPGTAEQSGMELVQTMEKRCEELGVHFEYGLVDEVLPQTGGFLVRTEDKEWKGSQLILATGTQPKKLGIAGESELRGRGISDCAPCDGPFFRGKPVAVVGSGDSACDDALFLAAICPEVHLLCDAKLSAQPWLVEAVQRRENIRIRYGSRIRSLGSEATAHGFPALNSVELESGERIAVSGLFVLIGSTPRYPRFPGRSPELNRSGKILTDRWCETTVPGLFAVGAVRDQQFEQIAVGIADGVVAARKAAANIGPDNGA